MDEAAVDGELDLGESRVDPEHQRRVGGGVRCAGRERTEARRCRSPHVGVHGVNDLADPLRLLFVPVDDQVERAQGVEIPAPEVVSVVGVGDDAGRDERMGDLEEDGRPGPEQRDER